MTTFAGSTALVTGGASGIGYLTGKRLLEQGLSHLVVWDVQDDALARVVGELTSLGHRVDGFRVDVTDLAQVRDALGRMRASGVHVDILVNNAGIVVGREFAAHTHDDVRRTMAVNALAPMHLALEILPGMLERRRGHVVNIASAAGLVSNPGMSVYCASKWAVIGWSDSLRIEMDRSRSSVQVTTVMPYYIDTGMFAGVRSRVLPILKPDDVAREIVAAIRKDRRFLYLPKALGLLALVRGLMPARLFDTIGGEWAGVYHSMRTFTGRVAAPASAPSLLPPAPREPLAGQRDRRE
jgi:all-trans-retinol dehydrogenase (NAD+)